MHIYKREVPTLSTAEIHWWLRNSVLTKLAIARLGQQNLEQKQWSHFSTDNHMSMHIPWAYCSKGALHLLEALNSGTGRLAHASLDLCKNLREKHHLYRVCQPLSSLVCRHIHHKMSRVHASSKCSYKHIQIQTLWKFLLLNLLASKTLEVRHKTD